jgi:hypothetical protein
MTASSGVLWLSSLLHPAFLRFLLTSGFENPNILIADSTPRLKPFFLGRTGKEAL